MNENGITRRHLLGAGLLLGAGSLTPANAALIPTPADRTPGLRNFEAEWEANLTAESEGYGVALLPEAADPTVTIKDWVEPNAPGVLALGFDTSNPKSRNRSSPDGNIYGRPEREISLHWDGTEIANRLCPVEIRPGHKARWTVLPAPGGAEVTVKVGDTAIYDRYFVPGVAFPDGKTRFANGGTGVTVSKTQERLRGKSVPLPTPNHIVALDSVRNDGKNHRQSADVNFPTNHKGIGRVVCTLTLGPTPEGLDPWDRIGQIFLYDENGEQFEVLRYMTPYRKGWTWHLDVTDLLPLFSGKKKIEMFCETWAEGWLVTVAFDFYPGTLKQVPYKVVNLWNGTTVIGQQENPSSNFFTTKTVPMEPDAKSVRVRLCVTGHGQAPNTANSAEFISLWRRFSANDKTWQDTLWKTDVYLNPCRPQSGTWKFDRAGWAPGSVVPPWTVDVTSAITPGQPATFRYEVEPFENKTPDKGNPARHLVSSQLVYYK